MGLYSYRGLVLNATRNNYFKIHLSSGYDWLSISGKRKVSTALVRMEN